MIKELARSRDAESQLHESSFRVVSVDNIDIPQSHAHVYTTAAERSFHGTSVQCVEPMPLSIARNARTRISHSLDTSVTFPLQVWEPMATQTLTKVTSLPCT